MMVDEVTRKRSNPDWPTRTDDGSRDFIEASLTHPVAEDSRQRPCFDRYIRPILGVLIVLGSSFMFTLTNVIVKAVDQVDPFTIAVFRFVGIFLPSIPIIIFNKQPFFPRGHGKMIALRSILGSTNLLIHFYGLKHMPIADVNMAAAAAPALTVLFARIFLKEKIIILDGVNLLLVAIGMVLIIKPPLIFGYGPEYEKDPDYYVAALALVIGCILQANVYIALRLLKSVPFATILFNFGLIGTLESGLFVILFSSPCLPACGWDRVAMVAVGWISFLAQIGLTIALQFESAGVTSLLRKAFDIVFSFTFQIILFQDIPGLFSVLGAILISIVIVGSGAKKIIDSLAVDHWIKITFLSACYPIETTEPRKSRLTRSPMLAQHEPKNSSTSD